MADGDGVIIGEQLEGEGLQETGVEQDAWSFSRRNSSRSASYSDFREVSFLKKLFGAKYCKDMYSFSATAICDSAVRTLLNK